jgi:hypothetical protein
MTGKDWKSALEKLEKPCVSLPRHKSDLLQVLKKEMYGKNNEGLTLNQLKGLRLMFRNTKAVVPVMAIVLIFVLSMYFSAGTFVAAYATLQVNPAIQLAIDGDKRVVEMQALNEDAKTLSSGLKLKGTGLSEALALLADRLIETGHVTPDRKIVLSFRPAEGKANDEMLVQLAEEAKQAILVSIGRKQLANEVKAAVISGELFEAALKEGLLPASYIDLVGANVTPDTILKIFRLGDTAGVNKAVFLEELGSTVSAAIVLLRAGFDENQVIALLRGALAADQEEVTTIASLLVALVEKGKPESEALAAILAALKADPGLENIDDLLNANDDSDDDKKDEEDDDHEKDEEDDDHEKDEEDDDHEKDEDGADGGGGDL